MGDAGLTPNFFWITHTSTVSGIHLTHQKGAKTAQTKKRSSKGEMTMNPETINQANEITIEIEELEEKIAPHGSTASFLD